VARELRARVKAALDTAGVAPAGPDTIVITAPPNGSSAAGEGRALPAVTAAVAAGDPRRAVRADDLGEAAP
jgi:hypothetical protein